MKRVVIALILLAVIAGAGVYALCRLSAVRTELSAQLDEIGQLAQTAGAGHCRAAAEKFYRQIRQETGWMSWWFHQNYLNELTQSSLLLGVYADQDCREDFLAQVTQCRQALDRLWVAEYPSLRSVF